MISTDVLIIGGGASGLLAALVGFDAGKEVMIVEGENRVAKKLISTGNGRCNFTNIHIQSPYNSFHSEDKTLYQNVLKHFTVQDTIDLFNFYGLPLVTLEKGRVYPQSLQASSVVDLFLMNIEERGIPVYLNSKVIDIKKENGYFMIKTNNRAHPLFQANKVIITCGGKSAPQTGSDGDMYKVLEGLGHHIIKPLPSIVQLKLDYSRLKAISGVRFDALAKVIVDNEVKREEYDEVLFTNYGISGPAILQLSRYASIGLNKKQEVKIVLDLFSTQSSKALKAYFDTRFSLYGHRSIFHSLIGVIHKKLIPTILKDSGIDDIHKTCDSLSYQEKIDFYHTIKNWTFKCKGTNGFRQAQTTIGGVDTKEICPNTLQSKLVKGLYFAGEVLDVDGDCGGYNLQWAWSSGYIAAKSLT